MSVPTTALSRGVYPFVQTRKRLIYLDKAVNINRDATICCAGGAQVEQTRGELCALILWGGENEVASPIVIMAKDMMTRVLLAILRGTNEVRIRLILMTSEK